MTYPESENQSRSDKASEAHGSATQVSPTGQGSLWVVERIVSGGQTGVDRGALDAAIAMHIDHGGWCPRGRLAEDGFIPLVYKLTETDASEYAVRTERNVIDSSGTLVLYKQRLQRGTLLTYRLAQRHGRPVLRVRLDRAVHIELIQEWLRAEKICVLNVAGPRESSYPGIAIEAAELLTRVLTTRPAPKLF